MTQSQISCSIFTILMLCSSTVFAQGGQRGGPREAPSFSDLDSSADGVLSREEFNAWITAAAERRGQRGDSGEGRPAGMGGDAQGDSRGADMFSRVDSDGDGGISETEFTAFTDTVRSRQGQRGQGDRRTGPRPGGGEPAEG